MTKLELDSLTIYKAYEHSQMAPIYIVSMNVMIYRSRGKQIWQLTFHIFFNRLTDKLNNQLNKQK